MGESNVRRRRVSSENIGTVVPKNICGKQYSKLGVCVLALSDGIKPGQWLAARVKHHGGKCSERHANLLIEGKRKPNARAALAVYAEIIG